jgi:hypothetical protein
METQDHVYIIERMVEQIIAEGWPPSHVVAYLSLFEYKYGNMIHQCFIKKRIII